MLPGERVDLIRQCARYLVTQDWADVDLILRNFGAPTVDEWHGSKDEYVKQMLSSDLVGEEQLRSLAEYVSGNPAWDPEAGPWTVGKFRLFITHVAKRKEHATELKRNLAFYGVDSFVAHEDIQPGIEWQREIITALHSCDAGAAMLHDGFAESPWCDQEVGVILGRGLVVIPIRYDFEPYGFIGLVQSVPGTGRDADDVARHVQQILLTDKRTRYRMIEAMVKQLEFATSFDQANALARLLDTSDVILDREQLERLREAQKANSQVENAWHVDGHLASIEQRVDAAHPPQTSAVAWNDDDPF